MPRQPKRVDHLEHLVAAIGGDIIRVDDEAGAWPALCRVRVQGADVSVAIHVATVLRTGRGRDEVERRIQNPGQDKPVRAPMGSLPLIVGLWEEEGAPVLVAFDASRRVGQGTRKSMFVKLEQLRQAATLGWAEAMSTSGEMIYAFTPRMLPAYVEMVANQVTLPTSEVANVLAAAGVKEGGAEAFERARRVTSQLVRNASFGRRVVDAYGGLCALCGIDSGLVQGAHVYPAGAPGSPDEVWNGVALCANHHTAFDRHLVWIAPKKRTVQLHATLLSDQNEACRAFVAATFKELHPGNGEGPRDEMFRQRYDFYDGRYGWADLRR